jgi:dienelactone hydrolase
MRLRSLRASIVGSLAIVVLALSSLVAGPSPVAAQAANPFQRGPAPTVASLTAARGPFATSSATVAVGSVTGFGGGRIYYPTSTSEGTFGAVVIAPGFTATSGAYAGLATRVASHGFVTFAIDTNSTLDFPDSRGQQILAALDYLTRSSTVRTRIDASRLAVAGHSMGGGGTLAAANARPSLQAAVALQPWHSTKSWSNIRVPTMIIGAESDAHADHHGAEHPDAHHDTARHRVPLVAAVVPLQLARSASSAGSASGQPGQQVGRLIAPARVQCRWGPGRVRVPVRGHG